MFNLNAPCNSTISISSILFFPSHMALIDCHAMLAIILPILCAVSITILLPKNVHAII